MFLDNRRKVCLLLCCLAIIVLSVVLTVTDNKNEDDTDAPAPEGGLGNVTFMISETMVNFTEAEKFCWNQQEMRLIRVMTEQKYHDVVNFAKRWLFGQFQMDGARWHREDFHTDMRITINGTNITTTEGNPGYTKWRLGFPYSLQNFKDNSHVHLTVSSDPNDKRQGMKNYGTYSKARPFCEKR